MKRFFKKGQKWLFTNWELGLAEFQIYDDSDSLNLITKRTIDRDDFINWFNLDNVKREIEEYAQKNNVKIKGLDETLQSIKSKGFSYTDADKAKAIKEADYRNKNYNKSNKLWRVVRVVE